MSDKRDPLEAELSALKPRDVSPQLRRQLADQLGETTAPGVDTALNETRRKALPWQWLVVASVVAASIAALLLSSNRSTEVAPNQTEPSPLVVIEPSVKTDIQPAPTVWAYRHAFNQSTQELDDLLSKHSESVLAPDPELAQISAVHRGSFVE